MLATTVLLLYVLHMSFNIMTLGGMAAAVGLIVDDAIVMIEHIVRRFREGGGSRHDMVRAAAREFTHPLTGSSAATIIIFLPLAFLSGVTGAFFKALSLTMASALVDLLPGRLVGRAVVGGSSVATRRGRPNSTKAGSRVPSICATGN